MIPWMVLCLLAVSFAWQRPAVNKLPNTFSGIHMIADCPTNANSISDSLAKFAATHYSIIVEEHNLSNLAKMRQYGSKFIHLMYRNSIAINKTWAPVPNDTGVYCRDVNGQYFSDAKNVEYTPNAALWAGTQYSMGTQTLNGNTVEVCTNPGYPPATAKNGYTRYSMVWHDHWIRTNDSIAVAKEAHGFWVDNLNTPYGGIVPNLWSELEWDKALVKMMDDAKKADPDLIFTPNCTNYNSRYMWAMAKKISVDGLGLEGFIDSAWGETGWLMFASRGLELDRLGKGWLPYVYGDDNNGADTRKRMFRMATYLVAKGSHSYCDQVYAYYYNWYPEFGLQVGYPLENKHLNVVDYTGAQNGYDTEKDTLVNVYRGGGAAGEVGWFYRRYSNALVVVNPMGGTIYSVDITALSPGKTYFEAQTPASVSGGFAVGSDGRPKAKMAYARAQTTYQVGPRSGYVFIADTNYVNPDTIYEPTVQSVEARPNGLQGAIGDLEICASPNPFHLMTSITLGSVLQNANSADYSLKIYDIKGRLVKDFARDNAYSGSSSAALVWKPENPAAGVYVIRMATHERIVSKRIILMN
jgi:hypothetical protein